MPYLNQNIHTLGGKQNISFYISIGLKHREYKTTICNCSNGFASKYIGLEIL